MVYAYIPMDFGPDPPRLDVWHHLVRHGLHAIDAHQGPGRTKGPDQVVDHQGTLTGQKGHLDSNGSKLSINMIINQHYYET